MPDTTNITAPSGYFTDSAGTKVNLMDLLEAIVDSANQRLKSWVPDVNASGNITAQNLNATGAGTAGSFIALATLQGMASGIIDVRGTYTVSGGLTLQGTLDGTNWNTLNNSLINETTGAVVSTIASGSTGAWGFEAGVYTAMRIVATGAVTGTAAVIMRAGAGPGVMSLDNPLPTGNNTIGGINLITLPTPTPYSLTSAASTNATSVKASAGTLYNVTISNTSASPRYVKLYNKASAPTVGTDVPIWTGVVAATSSQVIGFGAVGKRFSAGIALAITGAIGATDTTAIAAGDIQLTLDYV